MGNKSGKPSKKLSQQDLDDLLKRTTFTKKQISRWYRSFVKDCPDGVLTRRAFLDMYSQFFPDDKAQKFYEHLFRTFDSDNSGNIDFKEFLTAIHITQNGAPSEKLELAFKLYDIDNNGKIDRTEMAEIIKAIYLMVGAPDGAANEALTNGSSKDPAMDRTVAIFQRMDTNNDGSLSKEEFVNGCLNDETLFKLLACTDKAAA